MIILIICDDFPPNQGGIAMFAHNLCIQLCKLGHQVDVLTQRRDDSKTFDETQLYRIYRYPKHSRFSSIAPITKTLFLDQSNRYDIIFIGRFTTTQALGALMLHKLKNIPYVILSHANDLSYSVSTIVDELVARSLIRNAALMIGNSCLTAELILQKGYDKAVEVINPGVDPELFHSEVDTTEVFRKYSLDNHRVLLTVGRLEEKKNIESVLFALPEVLKRVPNVFLLVVGEGKDRKRLEILSGKLGLRPYVRFVEFIKNKQMPAIYCVSELFIMVTKGIESFGICFLEANACKKPVIASEIAGETGAVIDGETGLLVDPYDTDAIAEAIIRLLTSPGLARKLGENGRQRVEKELNWEIIGKKLEIYLKRVINKQ